LRSTLANHQVVGGGGILIQRYRRGLFDADGRHA
jgi:hypothetical protein